MAAGQSPNSTNISRVAAGVANATSVVVHPEFMYWRVDWAKIRDVISGSREVKRKAEIYLRRMPGQDDDAYLRYLERAVFYNMSAQTQTGMLGQVFRRDPVIKNLPSKFKDAIVNNFAKDGAGHVAFTKTVMAEVIAMGRFGVLVDVPETPSKTPLPYAVGYAAENILDWTVQSINGRYMVTRVLLREFVRSISNAPDQQNPWIGQRDPGSPEGMRATNAVQNAAQAAIDSQWGRNRMGQMVRPVNRYLEAYTYKTVYRELLLEQQEDFTWLYRQKVYSDDPRTVPELNFVPTVRGVPLSFIPFMFFGATSNAADCEKPPLLDIVDLNLSHYRTYADLEHGRVFTALPVYYAPGKDDEGASEYHIGPDMVWETPADAHAPGILEFHGTGLKALESALTGKEEQIAAIGGRLMPGVKSSESKDQTVLREANEQSLLLNVILSTEDGMREVFRWWMMWRDIPLTESENIRYEINQAFLSAPVGARELRAIHMMYDDGVIPVEVFYDYLHKAEVIDPDMTLDDFISALKDPMSFINSPDAQARQRGYATRQQELDQVSVAREADMQQQEIDLQERQVVLEEKAPPPKIMAPQAPYPQGPNPSKAAGPAPPSPGRSGKVSKAKKPNPGGTGGSGGN